MKRLLTVLAVASIFAAAPAVADYDSCMKYCIPEHGFDHCNPICAGGERKHDGKENKADRESAGNFGPCKTSDDKIDEIIIYIDQHHGSAYLDAYTYDDHPNEIGVEFDLYEDEKLKLTCKGTITVTASCDLIPDYQCESPDKTR